MTGSKQGRLAGLRARVEPDPAGFAILLNETPAKTPGRHPLVVPGSALAREIAREIEEVIAEQPGLLSGKGQGAQVSAPNFRIAAGAIDVIAGEPGARPRVVSDLAAYGVTDLVCFRSPHPEALAAAQDAAWTPLTDWFATEFGAPLSVTTGLAAPDHDPKALAAIRRAVETADDFTLAALSLAIRAAGSVVIGLALARGRIDAEAAFAAATVDETYQAERWGADDEATRAREATALDLRQAARFLALLAEG
jgi:chaperone required for assembly of F1-ATPase